MASDSKQLIRQIAAERIEILFDLALNELSRHSDDSNTLSRSYASKIARISAHYRVKIPKRVEQGICNKCHFVLMPGLNATVKVVSTHSYVAIKCGNCGAEKHIFYK
ncbi:MAG: ribonuclease P protein component 4 [Candidatus Micrarchaeia archaeon]